MNATSHQNADARYAAALELVCAIDEHLQERTRHYRDTQGRLLLSLDEVVQAILTDNLIVETETDHREPSHAEVNAGHICLRCGGTAHSQTSIACICDGCGRVQSACTCEWQGSALIDSIPVEE
jgi:hypothetical protein